MTFRSFFWNRTWKTLTGLFLVLSGLTAQSQTDSSYVWSVYRRAMSLDESNVDSISVYADLVHSASRHSAYPGGLYLELRLRGFYFENKSEYEKAIDYYFQSLQEARRAGSVTNERTALTDLAAVYTSDLKRPDKAKEFYVQCVDLTKKGGDIKSLVAAYTNLGAIYNRLGLYDSALLFMGEGLRLGKPLEEKGEDDLTSLYNNMGNSYYEKKDYDQSIYYFMKDYRHHSIQKNLPDIWLDVLNLADAYTEKSLFGPASRFADSSLLIARQLHSRSKEADSYSIGAKLFARKGEYRKAYEYLQNWYRLDTAMVNEDTYRNIAELQEKFHARERENEKLLLEAEVARAKFNNRIILIAAVGLLLTGIFAFVAFFIKINANRKLKKTNDLITRQNEKLADLNHEKNTLISIVSHDLSTPFATIDMWSQLLESDGSSFSQEQQKALSRIRHSTGYGQQLIRNILDVEKADISQRKLDLESIDLHQFAQGVVEEFQQAAAAKNIHIHLDLPGQPVFLISDRQLMSRICENLLSNAIKFSHPGKRVWVQVGEERDAILITVRDEGVGIPRDELPRLFNKYGNISSRPTQQENSNGLGLSIVKRIVRELNGDIRCESEIGLGSLFTVILKK
jgi:signal transduction histidine kinase